MAGANGRLSGLPRNGHRAFAVPIAAAAIFSITACTGSTGSPSRSGPPPTSRPEAGVTVLPTPEIATGRNRTPTHVRFAVGGAQIVVRIVDNPTSRDFVSMLPLTLRFRDLNAMEKVSNLPRRLTTDGSTGRAPANGDLIYFIPWGNLGFFYNAARRDASFDDRVIPIGTVETGSERLSMLETGPVRVERR
ncbi:MAG: cyclophilin-like fold protein [Armatimonadota bacterium]